MMGIFETSKDVTSDRIQDIEKIVSSTSSFSELVLIWMQDGKGHFSNREVEIITGEDDTNTNESVLTGVLVILKEDHKDIGQLWYTKEEVFISRSFGYADIV